MLLAGATFETGVTEWALGFFIFVLLVFAPLIIRGKLGGFTQCNQ